MRIRSKIILVVLPLLIAPLALLGIASFYAARNGITGVATEFLAFKAEQVAAYAESQWAVLEQNSLSNRPEFVDLAEAAVASFARSMVRSPTELIFALQADGTPGFATSEISPEAHETIALTAIAREDTEGWREIRLAGVDRVAQTVRVEPFQWMIVVSESRATFYRATEQILEQGLAILGAAALLAIAFLLVFSGYLTRPLRLVVKAMRGVIGSTDLSQRVQPLYRDETGELATTFNLMTGELEQAYGQIKSYAIETAIARKREQQLRNIFQKFVPKDVIDQFIKSPESMLKGRTRKLAIMFSDIRDFTSITERMQPDELVDSLNAHFTGMVDAIVTRRGIVDKYIGDCIMAFFGAPRSFTDDAWQAVQAAFDMLDSLARFNERQHARKKTPFRIGIGISYGEVTLGNIGSDKKMDYTVIGEEVNLAARMESLTKDFHEPLVFTDTVRKLVADRAPCRPLGVVMVKGISLPVHVWTARRAITEVERRAWELFGKGLSHFNAREFGQAVPFFTDTQKLLPGDGPSRRFLGACRTFSATPPGPTWTGTLV